jgi:hypothetical protein
MIARHLSWTAAAAIYLLPHACGQYQASPASPDATRGRQIDDSAVTRPQQPHPRLPRVTAEGAINLSPTGSVAKATTRAKVQSAAPVGDQSQPGANAGASAPRTGADSAAPNVSLRTRAAESSLLAARVAFLEGGFSLSDAAAITYVLKARARRSGWTFARTALAYSALDSDTPRAVFARQLPASDEPTFSARENERWALVRAVVRAALDGRVRNPAPGARHWGSRVLANDVRRAKRAVDAGRWRAIASATRNAFFAELRHD